MTALPSDRPVDYDAHSVPKAGFGVRLVAAIVDTVILVALGIPLALPLGILGRAGDVILWAGYFAILEGGPSGQSWGKRMAQIRVVDITTGESIGRARALFRHVARWLSGIALGLGYLWMLWDPKKQTWHDKISGAVVVPVRTSDRQAC